MLITCPSCASAYHLPAERIGAAGRKVRCASCRESWFVASPEKPSLDIDFSKVLDVAPTAEGMQPSAVDESAASRRASHRRPNIRAKAKAKAKSRAGGRTGSSASPRSKIAMALAMSLLLLLPGLLAFRAQVVGALPGTASLYRAIGLPVNLVGLSLAGIRSNLVNENGTQVLEVSGDITNVGRVSRPVPPLQIAIEGEGGETLYAWSARAAEGNLETGQTAPFRVRLTAPPPASHRVEVTFRDESGRRSAALH